MDWEDFFSEVKITACDTLFKGQAEVDNSDFALTFTIVRQAPQPTRLSTDREYEYMIRLASKMAEPNVKILITRLTPIDVGLVMLSIAAVLTIGLQIER